MLTGRTLQTCEPAATDRRWLTDPHAIRAVRRSALIGGVVNALKPLGTLRSEKAAAGRFDDRRIMLPELQVVRGRRSATECCDNNNKKMKSHVYLH
ncbi:MAG: hypothetical protein ACT4TC_26105 [Myxococcaceae bacterium]